MKISVQVVLDTPNTIHAHPVIKEFAQFLQNHKCTFKCTDIHAGQAERTLPCFLPMQVVREEVSEEVREKKIRKPKKI